MFRSATGYRPPMGARAPMSPGGAEDDGAVSGYRGSLERMFRMPKRRPPTVQSFFPTPKPVQAAPQPQAYFAPQPQPDAPIAPGVQSAEHAAFSKKVGELNPDAEWIPTPGAGGGYFRKRQGSALTDAEFLRRQQDAVNAANRS